MLPMSPAKHFAFPFGRKLKKQKTMHAIEVINNPTLEQLIEIDGQARAFALSLVAEKSN